MTEFFNNLTTVSLQVLILFFLVAIGYISGKTRILNETAAKAMSSLCLTFATPAVIIKSFDRDFSGEIALSFLLSFG